MVDRMADFYSIILSVFVILIGIATKCVSHLLIKNYKQRAQRANATHNEMITIKLRISGNIIFVCFVLYAVITFVAVFDERTYLAMDYLFEAIIKLSDCATIAVIFYLY